MDQARKAGCQTGSRLLRVGLPVVGGGAVLSQKMLVEKFRRNGLGVGCQLQRLHRHLGDDFESEGAFDGLGS